MRIRRAWADTDKRGIALITALVILALTLILKLYQHKTVTDALQSSAVILFGYALVVLVMFVRAYFRPVPIELSKFQWTMSGTQCKNLTKILKKHSMKYGGELAQRAVEIRVQAGAPSGYHVFARRLLEVLQGADWYVLDQGLTSDSSYRVGLWLEDGDADPRTSADSSFISSRRVLAEGLEAVRVKASIGNLPSTSSTVEIFIGFRGD